jgi:hypothetical protein
MTLIRSDDFSQADGPLNSNWTQGMGAASATFAVNYGGLQASTKTATWIDTVWSKAGDSFTSNQFSEIQFRASGDVYDRSLGAGVSVLRTVGGNGYCVFWLESGSARTPGVSGFDQVDGGLYLYTMSSGAMASGLISNVAQACKPGDTLRLVATTNATTGVVTLSVYWNGVHLAALDYVDSANKYSGGAPGIVLWESSALGQIESWFGGDGDGSTSVTHPAPPKGLIRVPNAMFTYNPRLISGVRWLDVISPTNYGTTAAVPSVRFIEPDSPAAGVRHKWLVMLPVEDVVPGNWGDPVAQIVDNNLHNTYNMTIVAPLFTSNGTWGMDSDLNTGWRNESFVVNELVPWLHANFPIQPGERTMLIGFSRSGFAAMTLMIRHPTLFDVVCMWDFPMESVTFDYLNTNYDDVCGSEANFDTYVIDQAVLDAQAQTFRAHYRMVIGENDISNPTFNGAWSTDLAAFKPQLDSAGIKYQFVTTTATAHRYDSGWIPEMIPVLAQTADAMRRRFAL